MVGDTESRYQGGERVLITRRHRQKHIGARYCQMSGNAWGGGEVQIRKNSAAVLLPQSRYNAERYAAPRGGDYPGAAEGWRRRIEEILDKLGSATSRI